MAGYRVSYKMLDARDYGVAQERKRVFIVGIRSDLKETYQFPAPTHGEGLKPTPTIREKIGKMPEWPDGEFNDEPFHWYYMSRNRYRGWDQAAHTVVAKGRATSLHPISPQLRRIHTDKWVFTSDRPARRLSYRECARLQGFSAKMKFPDTVGLDMRYRVVGNAVPPPLFAAVAKPLFGLLHG